jgi:hypothetical protein
VTAQAGAVETSMNQISSGQWAQMGRQSFDARLIAIIRRFHPEQAARLDFTLLVGAIDRQQAKARHYGLTDEHSIATYVYTAWLMGDEFDTRIPAVAQILADPTLACSAKARALSDFSRLVFRTLAGDGAGAAAPQRRAA